MGDNLAILHLLKQRLNLGLKRYGHGVQIHDNTKKYGTPTNDWQMMALEELLDGMIYTTASILRYQQRYYISGRIHDDNIIDERTQQIIKREWVNSL